jgi:hypothetical protein
MRIPSGANYEVAYSAKASRATQAARLQNKQAALFIKKQFAGPIQNL